MNAPSIEGTYRLMRRELPDGTVQMPPAVKGTISFTKDIRNFSVVWKDDQGKYFSECYVARYSLSDKEYRETQDYLIVDDEIGGKGISHDLSAHTASSPVTIEGKHIGFDLPQPFEQALHIHVDIDGDQLKATGKDMFVDYWKKMN